MQKLAFIFFTLVAAQAFAQPRLTARDQRNLNMKNMLVRFAQESARADGDIRIALEDEIESIFESRNRSNQSRFLSPNIRIGIIDRDMQSQIIHSTDPAFDRVELTFNFNCARLPMIRGVSCIELMCKASMNVAQYRAQRTTDTLAVFQVACSNNRISGLSNVNAVVDIASDAQ